jgi:hypothetical protein
VTHTNRSTEPDTVLVEKASYTIIVEDNWTTQVNAGLFWHLRDPVTGKLVVVQAGLVEYDAEGNALRYTPNFDPDFWNVVCPALGGAVA